MKNYLLIPFVFLLLLASCTVTVNEKSEMETIKNENGFSYEEKTVSINTNFAIKNNEIIAGEYLVITFSGVKNATLKDGYQHVGLGLKILDEAGTVLEESTDLMANVEQQAADLDKFHVYYTVPTTFKEGSKITFITTLYDKYGTVSYETKDEFIIVNSAPPATENMLIESNLPDVDSILPQLFKGHKQFTEVPISIAADETLDLYLNKVKGFKIIGENVFIKYTIQVFNDNGEQIASQSDEFTGKIEQDAFYQLTASQEFNNIEAGNYLWVVTYNDANSDKYIKTIVDVIIE
jgi:hypothetical protein